MTRATLTADQIRPARLALGLKQAELAQAIGFTGPDQISRIERGASMPQTQTLLAIECLLHRAKKWPLST